MTVGGDGQDGAEVTVTGRPTAEVAQPIAVQLTAHVYLERPFDPTSLVPGVLGAIVVVLVVLRGLVAVSRLRRRYQIVRRA